MGLFSRRRVSRSSSPLRVRRGKNALTASGFRVRSKDTDVMRRLIQPWQSRAFSYYEAIGEVRYAASFYSRMLAPLRLFPAVMDESGDLVETEEPLAVEALERIQDPGGGRTGLLTAYGRLMFLAGECYLFVSKDEDGLEQWEVLSTDELRIQGGNYIRYKAPSLIAEDYRDAGEEEWEPIDDRTAVAYRLWQRSPRYSWLAESTMQGILSLCEELMLLEQNVRAHARSRLSVAGILWIDERVSPAPLEPAPDEDPEEDPFLADITESITTPIVDEGSAAAIVPHLIRVPVPDGLKVSDMVYHMQVTDPNLLYPETGLRLEVIKRMALSLDMPPEVLLGTADVNHWSSWSIDEQSWKVHGQPKAQQLVDDLTASYYRPYLRDNGVQNWQDYAIGYDASAIINHPDRTKDAKDLYSLRVIGKRAAREAAGFDEEDAMTQEELWESLGVAIRDGSLALYGIPSKLGLGGIEPEAGTVLEKGVETSAPTGATQAGEVQQGPPQTGGPNENGSETAGIVATAAAAARTAHVIGAADLALVRAREAAGNRLKSLAKKNPEMREIVNGSRPWQVANLLGPERVKALKVTDRDLVAGARVLILDAFRLWGISPELAELIAEKVEQHAARTLFDEHPAPMPQSLTNYVAGLMKR